MFGACATKIKRSKCTRRAYAVSGLLLAKKVGRKHYRLKLIVLGVFNFTKHVGSRPFRNCRVGPLEIIRCVTLLKHSANTIKCEILFMEGMEKLLPIVKSKQGIMGRTDTLFKQSYGICNKLTEA